VGPLPSAVYWRRRWVALASVVTVAGLLTVAVGGPTPTDGPAAVPAPAAVRSTVARPQPAATDGPAVAAGTASTEPAPRDSAGVAPLDAGLAGPTSSGPTAPGGRPSTGQPGDGATTAVPPSPGPVTAASGPYAAASSTAASERIRPDDTPRPTVAAQPPVPVPRTGPVPCTNDMLTAGAEIDPAVHKLGSHPVLRLVITNVSGQPCVRDLDAARQEIVVWSGDGAARLWSSNDCINNPTVDLRTLVPGRPVAFALTWGERTTTPGCAQPRTVVPAGSYRLMVRLDDLISPPTPFLRTP
jgi:hypothetical protein